MNKSLIAAAVLGAALAAYAQTKTQPAPQPAPASTQGKSVALPAGMQAVGWDGNYKHVTARIGLTQNNAVDVGVGVNINSATDENEFGVSGLYLLKLQDWGVVDNYLAAGGKIDIADEVGLTAFAGLQPEITFMERFIVSVRFGLEAALVPDFALQTVGSPISLVEGLNFKIIW